LALALLGTVGAGCVKQAKASRHLARGNRYSKAERYDKAEIEYLLVLRSAPQHPTVIRQLGFLYYEEGRLPQAFSFLRKAAELVPDDPEVQLKLGLLNLAFRRLKDAREAAAWVLAKQPLNDQALLLLAEAATTNEARELSQRLAQLPEDLRRRANCHLASGLLAAVQQDLAKAETEFRAAVAADPKSSDAQATLARLYLMKNDRAQAEATLKKAVEQAPLRSTLRLMYAELQVRGGAQAEAQRQIEEITRKAPDYLPAWTFLSQLAFARGRTEECATLVNAILARDPGNHEALLLRGNLLLAKGDGTDAIAHFEHLAGLYDLDPEVQYRLALAHLVNNEPAKANANLTRALLLNSNYVEAALLQAQLNLRLGDPGAAIDPLARLIKRQPELARAYLLLAQALLAQNRPDDAVAVCRQMVLAFPKEPQALMFLADLLVRQGRLPDCRQALQKAWELAPHSLPVLERLADLDLAENQYPAATARIQAEINQNAASAGAWLLMGKVHVAQAQAILKQELQKRAPSSAALRLADVPGTKPDVDEAEKALLKALQLDPKLAPAYFSLAQLYVGANRQQEALAQLNQLVARTNNILARMEIGAIQRELKNYAAAREAYEKVLVVNSNFVPALNNLASLYSVELKQPDRAYPLAEEARRLQPDGPEVADTLGWILCQRGQYDRALALIGQAAPKLASDPEVQFHLGLAHYMLGEEAPARAALEQALKASQDFPGKAEARQRLATLAIDPKTAQASQVAELRKRSVEAPNDSVAASRLAAVLERDGAFDQAAACCEAALKNNPASVPVKLRLASLYADHLNNRARALALAKDAHSQAPDSAEASHLLGRLAYQTGDHTWSASLLEESARRRPGEPAILYDLAWARYSLGRITEAEAAMQTPALAPGFGRAAEAKRFLEMAAATTNLTRAAQSLADLRQTLAAEPDYVPALFLSALLDEQQGRYKEAAARYDRILARYPLFAPATRNLALLCAERLGQDTKAFTLAAKARESFPEDARVARTLGILAYRQKDYSRSAELLLESIRNTDNDAEAFCYLGLAQHQLKQPAASQQALQRALALNVQPPLANEARRVLAELKGK
jgi:tetratricopeptide (TPR) repeat protein